MENYTGKKITTFRERFAELCDSSPKNATEISEDLHVSKQTISAWKSGERSPKKPMAIFIAKYFGVSLEWIMGFDCPRETTWIDYDEVEEENRQRQSKEARIISGGIEKMPPEKQEQALKVLQAIFAEYFDGGEKK